jgi:molecular chaperone GrpE (heat shock protein)
MLEKAQEHLKDQGLAIATLEFKKILNEEGVTEILPKVGELFDHELHEVIETVENGKKDTIAEIVIPGWKYNDGQVLRYAKVKVYN